MERGSDVKRLLLYLTQSSGSPVFRYLQPDGSPDAIPALRLTAYVNLIALVPLVPESVEAVFPECVVDTGSHLTTIPEWIHSHFKPGAVTPLPFDPAMPAAHRTLTIAGGVYPYELALVPLRLQDREGETMDLDVVALLTRDGGALRIPMTIGLSGGVLDGHKLTAAPDLAAAFGQVWTLEEA